MSAIPKTGAKTKIYLGGQVVFEDLYTPKSVDPDKPPKYGLTLKIKKDSEDAKKLKAAFLKVASAEKVTNKAKSLWQKMVKDGDSHEIWSEYESNAGHLILNPKSKNPVPIWKKEGKKLVITSIPNEVSWGDNVRCVLVLCYGYFRGAYITAYLNGVTLIKKATNPSYEDTKKFLESEEGVSVDSPLSTEENLSDEDPPTSSNKTTKKRKRRTKAEMQASQAKAHTPQESAEDFLTEDTDDLLSDEEPEEEEEGSFNFDDEL